VRSASLEDRRPAIISATARGRREVDQAVLEQAAALTERLAGGHTARAATVPNQAAAIPSTIDPAT